MSRSYLENSRWKVNFVPWKKLYRSNYWGVRSQEWWCSKKKKEGKRNGKRRKGREGFNRHCCTSMPENFHHRPLILSLSSLTNVLLQFSFLFFFSLLFSSGYRRTTTLALRSCNYGIVSRNGRVPRIFVRTKGGEEKAVVNLKFSARSRVAIKLDTQWNHERFHKTHVRPDLLVGWEWGCGLLLLVSV